MFCLNLMVLNCLFVYLCIDVVFGDFIVLSLFVVDVMYGCDFVECVCMIGVWMFDDFDYCVFIGVDVMCEFVWWCGKDVVLMLVVFMSGIGSVECLFGEYVGYVVCVVLLCIMIS